MRVEQGIGLLEGELVLDNATRVLAEARAALKAGARGFDLAGVGQVDSSALSLLLSLRRQAGATALTFSNTPESLISLARLYGISDLLR